MIREADIYEALVRFLAGEISLDDFEDWFVQQSWNMDLDSDESAQQLASAIELKLAEYSNGHLSNNELSSFFREISKSHFVRIYFENARNLLWNPRPYSSASTSQIAPLPVEFRQVYAQR